MKAKLIFIGKLWSIKKLQKNDFCLFWTVCCWSALFEQHQQKIFSFASKKRRLDCELSCKLNSFDLSYSVTKTIQQHLWCKLTVIWNYNWILQIVEIQIKQFWSSYLSLHFFQYVVTFIQIVRITILTKKKLENICQRLSTTFWNSILVALLPCSFSTENLLCEIFFPSRSAVKQQSLLLWIISS